MRPVEESLTTISRLPKICGSAALMYEEGELRYMRALLTAFAFVVGYEKSIMLRPVKKIE